MNWRTTDCMCAAWLMHTYKRRRIHRLHSAFTKSLAGWKLKNVREILATDEVKAFSQPLQLLETSRRGKHVLGGVYKIYRLTIEAGVWKMPETKLAMYFKRRQLHTLVAQNSKRLLIEHWKFAIQDLLENKGDGK